MANKEKEEDHETSSPVESNANNSSTKQEKLQQANLLKDEGNAFYKQKNLKNAMKKYHHALMYVKGLVTENPFQHFLPIENGDSELTEDLKNKALQIECTCYNNLAACHVASSRWAKVVDYSSKVLVHQPNNVKALYRRGQAHMNLKDIDRAKVDLRKAHDLEPSDNAIKKTLTLLDKEFKRATEKEKKTYAAMFEKTSG